MRLLALTALLLAMLIPTVSSAAVLPGLANVAPIAIDDEAQMTDCLELAGPGEISASHLTGGDDVTLDVMLLVDSAEGVAIQQMDDDAERAAATEAYITSIEDLLLDGSKSYAPLGVTVAFSQSELLTAFKADGTLRDREGTNNAGTYIQMGKDQVGGVRPDGIDIVYVATDINTGTTYGLADCIGGVELDDRAFAMGSLRSADTVIGVQFSTDGPVKVFSHELGHLMGAHHHYQSCGDGSLAEANDNGDVGPCSLMTNAVNFQLLQFSPVNSAVVRGHAESFASLNDH